MVPNKDMNIPGSKDEERPIEKVYDPAAGEGALLIDITLFYSLLRPCFEAAGAKKRQKAINALLSSQEWVKLHTDRESECSVYTEKEDMDHAHEISTAKALAAMDYDVLFAPAGMFARDEKRFDVFLIRGHVILKADLKSLTTKNPDTIAQRIRGGCEQANRLVIDIVSDIEAKKLVDGLRSGVTGQSNLKEILLFYRNRFLRLTKQDIQAKSIYKLLQ